MASVNDPLLSLLIQSPGKDIGERGTKSLSEALRLITTRTELDLCSEHKRDNTQIASINNPLFPFSPNQQITTLEKQVQHQ